MTHPHVPHPHVRHPLEMIKAERTTISAASGWLASHFALVFGATTTVWVFLIVPLVILLFPSEWQQIVFYLASGWVQLWALPLLTYVANKADAVRAAKADVDHVALTAMHNKLDTVLTVNTTQDDRLSRIEHQLGIAG